jgi:hypothetical protein
VSAAYQAAAIRTPGASPVEDAARALIEQYYIEVHRSTWPVTENDCDPSIPAKVEPQAAKVRTEIEHGERTIRELTDARWRAVGVLIQTQAARSWSQIGATFGVTGGEARRDFCAWITAQHITHLHDRDTRRNESTGLIEHEVVDLLGYAAELPVSTGGAQ